MAPRNTLELEIGSKHYEWTVMAPAEKDKHGATQYKFQCSCGFIKDLPASRVRYGYSKRCRPCHYKRYAEHQRIYQSKDESGMVYNGWIVLEKVGRDTYTGTHYFSIYKVKHSCGEERIVRDFHKFKKKSIRCWRCKPKKDMNEGK